MFNKRTYLDFAAGVSGNPSSPHTEGRKAKQKLEDARTTIARLIEVRPDDVVFTSGATESNALAILGHIRALLHLEPCTLPLHVMYLPSAHASIVENIKLLGERGVEIEALPIKNYRADIAKLAEMLRPETVLVSMDAVCGETGVIWNTREVAEILQETLREVKPCGKVEPRGARALLHVDASQTPLTEKITRAHFGADILTFDASKVGAARGIGALIAHRTIPISSLYAGGGQERGLRSGSEMPELAATFAEDLNTAVLGREQFRVSAERERARLIKSITSTIPNVYINESRNQAPNILNISFPGRDTDYLVALLDEAGFAVSTRSACETDSANGSRAVFALTGDNARARATLRISWGPNISSCALARFAKALTREVNGSIIDI